MRLSLKIAALGLVLFACGGAAQTQTDPASLPKTTDAPKTYAIHLSRASHVGDRLRTIADKVEDKRTKVTIGDVVADDKHEHRVLHVDAVSTIIALNDHGLVTRTKHDVKELTIDGRPVVHGVVEITRAPKAKDAQVTVDGAAPSEEARDALAAMLKLNMGGVSDDDVFGTKTPQAVGAHWAVNTQLAHDDLRDDSGLDATSVKGDVWLDSLKQVAGMDCLDVRAKLDLDGLTPPEVPEGSTVETGRADADFETALPVNGSLERASDRMTMSVAFRLRMKTQRGPALVAVTLSEKREAKFSAP